MSLEMQEEIRQALRVPSERTVTGRGGEGSGDGMDVGHVGMRKRKSEGPRRHGFMMRSFGILKGESFMGRRKFTAGGETVPGVTEVWDLGLLLYRPYRCRPTDR